MLAKANPYRIVHLSDLHLTTDDDAERSEPVVFRHKLRGMNGNFRRLLASSAVRGADLLVVTGDVTDRGDPESWSNFWVEIKNAGLKKVLIVPGNHDVCCLGARLPKPGDGYKKADLEKALNGLRLGGAGQLRFPWVAIPDPRVAIIGLNSNNLGNFTAATNAMGSLGFYQLSSLASKLHTVRSVPVKILMLHHSPNIPAEEVEEKRGLKPFNKLDRIGHQIEEAQEKALQLLSITHRLRLVLHGHLHRSEVRRVGGIKIVGAPASTEPMNDENGVPSLHFFSYTILGDGGRVKTRPEKIGVQ